MAGIPTLIVDDEPQIREILRFILAAAGCDVEIASDGREAIERTREKPFELVITDLRMPGMSGLEVLEKIKASYPETAVVVISGHATLSDTVHALRLGALDFVSKPFRKAEIEQILSRFRRVKREMGLIYQYPEALREASRRIELPSDPAAALSAATALTQDLAPLGLATPAERESAALALHEAILNAIIHGNLGIPSTLKEEDRGAFERAVEERRGDPAYGSRKVGVRFHGDRASAEYIVEDEGTGFDYRELADANDPEMMLRASGRGLVIIRLTMDEVSWNETGSSIRMSWRRRRS